MLGWWIASHKARETFYSVFLTEFLKDKIHTVTEEYGKCNAR